MAFQISYTLDTLLFIDVLLTPQSDVFEADIEKFMPKLGTLSDKSFKKLEKAKKKDERIIRHVIDLFLVNDELHNWTILELLDNPKRVISEFKKSPAYKKASPQAKDFASGKFLGLIPHLRILASDLERLGFKQYWLENYLSPLKNYQTQIPELLATFDTASHLSPYLNERDVVLAPNSYVSTYLLTPFETTLNTYNLFSVNLDLPDAFEKIVVYALKEDTYRRFLKPLRKFKWIKAQLKEHPDKKDYKNLGDYLETNFKMALKVHLMDGIPENTGRFVLPEEYPLASQMLEWMKLNPIQGDVKAYIEGLNKGLEKT